MQRGAKASADRIHLKEISVVKAEPVTYNTTEKKEKAQGIHHIDRVFRI